MGWLGANKQKSRLGRGAVLICLARVAGFEPATNSGASLANVRSMTGHATTDMALHYFHENEAGLKRTIAMLPVIGGDASASAKPLVGEFDAFLNGLDRAALKRLRKAVDERLVGK